MGKTNTGTQSVIQIVLAEIWLSAEWLIHSHDFWLWWDISCKLQWSCQTNPDKRCVGIRNPQSSAQC